MNEQHYYGHGKLLLTGEYFVIDGAQALALPLTVGQSMKVRYRHSYSPMLNWKSLNHKGEVWFESDYEFWHFNTLKTQDNPTQKFIQDLLRAVRKQNVHFLRDEADVFVETKVEFPLEWGLGSSSTLLYNVAQWAYCSPFELLKNTIGGSGYDIACAQAHAPIKFSIENEKPQWAQVNFNPEFKEQLFFVYLGQKQSSEKEVISYKNLVIESKADIVRELSSLTSEMISARDLNTFNRILRRHEEIVGQALKRPLVKSLHFADYWGEVKSLGAWGGDFVLVTSDRGPQETRDYFHQRGFSTMIPYEEIVCRLP